MQHEALSVLISEQRLSTYYKMFNGNKHKAWKLRMPGKPMRSGNLPKPHGRQKGSIVCRPEGHTTKGANPANRHHHNHGTPARHMGSMPCRPEGHKQKTANPANHHPE